MSEKLSYSQKRRIKKIKKKKAKIDKLTEDMKKMGKMVLKDGKLQKVEDVAPENPVDKDLPPMPPPQETKQPLPLQPEQPLPLESEQPLPPPSVPQPNPFDNIQQPISSVTPQVPSQQFVQQPQVPPQASGEVANVFVRLIEGETVDIKVPGNQLELMLKTLSEAIDSQSTFQVGSKVLNGRHIIFYSF